MRANRALRIAARFRTSWSTAIQLCRGFAGQDGEQARRTRRCEAILKIEHDREYHFATMLQTCDITRGQLRLLPDAEYIYLILKAPDSNLMADR